MTASCSHPKPLWCICASPWPCSTHPGRPRCPHNSSQIPHTGQWQPQPHSCSAFAGGLPSPKSISQHFIPTDPQTISELPNRMLCYIIYICAALWVPGSWLGAGHWFKGLIGQFVICSPNFWLCALTSLLRLGTWPHKQSLLVSVISLFIFLFCLISVLFLGRR